MMTPVVLMATVSLASILNQDIQKLDLLLVPVIDWSGSLLESDWVGTANSSLLEKLPPPVHPADP